MGAQVYFCTARPKDTQSLLVKVEQLFAAAGFDKLFATRDKVAVKIHWGETGNVGFVPVPYIRAVVKLVAGLGADPFVTDSNSLYRGMRFHALTNLRAAAYNGFTAETMGAPLLVADGLVGHDFVEVEVNGRYIQRPLVASAIHHADGLLVVSHIKGHMLFGFGGALKQLSMGCAAPRGKLAMHSSVKPKVIPKRCIGCGTCVEHCPTGAIRLVESDRPEGSPRVVAIIDREVCIGCGECVVVCPEHAIPINWKTAQADLFGRSADYALAALRGKRGKCAFLSFLINLTPDCDCCSWHDLPIAPDVGFLASTDPVAIDQAAIDLVDAAPVMPGSVLDGKDPTPGKFQAVHGVDPTLFLDACVAAGVGERGYELIRLD
ncbi:MAG: DUF362 domain-containing protein [Bradymonadales bacterium]|nr:DUF362 domain-containing protein [Bradymonadales bacterium]